MRALMFSVLLLIAGPAAAQVNCDNATTQADMNRCAALDLQRANDEINATYADLRRGLSKAQQEELRQIQLAWIRFKDLQCQLESSVAEGGSMQPLLRDTCLTTLTNQRNTELRSLRRLLTN